MRTLPIVVVILCASAAGAVTDPISGAVALPASLQMSWPFAAGEAVHVLSGYSPSGGSSLHDGTSRTSSANDYYALDLTLEEHDNHGKGQPVLAAAAGVVVKAGWATAGWANYGQRIILQHDPGDGHVYTTLYAHLDRIDVQEGDVVEKGAIIGALGSSCQGELSCGSFGTPHLHFAVHRDSTIGGSGSGGSYGGNAVVPEILDGAENLSRNDVHVSENGGPVAPPPPDPACVFAGEELALEEDGPCARSFGPSEYWHGEDGHGGASQWTYAVDDATPDNSVRWTLHVESATELELFAVIPANATSKLARYAIGDVDVIVDQEVAAGTTVSLGVVSASAGPVTITLADNTGEPYTGEATSPRIAFDAILARLPLTEEPPVDVPPDEPPPEGEEPAPVEPSDDEAPADPAVDNEPTLDPSVAGGCGSAPVGATAPLAVLVFLLRRRR